MQNISPFLTPDAQWILKKAEKYCKLSGIAPATLSTKIMNDGKFLDRVAAGKGFTNISFHKIKNWFGENMPKSSARIKQKNSEVKENHA